MYEANDGYETQDTRQEMDARRYTRKYKRVGKAEQKQGGREGRKYHANTSIAAGVMRDICMILSYGGWVWLRLCSAVM